MKEYDERAAELVADARAELGEGPVWDHRKGLLYWLDITGKTFHVFDPATGKDRGFDTGVMIGCAVLSGSGLLTAATERGIASVDPERGTVKPLLDMDIPNGRFNDGKAGPDGSFWAGTLGMAGSVPGSSALYRIRPDLSASVVLDGVTTSNGIDWSPDARTMYYIDTPTGYVGAFDFDSAAGTISNRRRVVEISPEDGMPDGMCSDSEGMIWVAHWGGGMVSRWNPVSGERLAVYRLPAENVTSCAFGGPALDDLYVTTARAGSRAPTASAGGLFRIRPGVIGKASFPFE